MTRIYLIRHAEAEGNVKRLLQGQINTDLSEKGERQLDKLSERCKGLKFDAVYASPLLRAQKTAQAANRHQNLPIQTEPQLIEVNFGKFDGMKWEDFCTKYPKESMVFKNEPWNFAPEGGEPMREVYDRIWNAVNGIAKKHAGQTVCVVSHGFAIRNFLCRAYHRPVEELSSIGFSENTAISVVEYDEDFEPRIVLDSDYSHLDYETSEMMKQA